MASKLHYPLRVATLNVRGLGARRRQCQLSRLFLENELDLVAVQETKLESEEQTDRMVVPFRTQYDVCVCHSVGLSGGCALFIRNNLGITEEAVTVCQSGRLLVVDFSFSARFWRVVCVYAPNVERERKIFFEALEKYLRCDKMIILLGDFNCVCKAADRANCHVVRDKSAEVLNMLISENNLEDLGSVLTDGVRPQFTHFQRGSNARLDRLYVSLELAALCTGYEVKPVHFSDHCLVVTTLGNKERKARFNWETWKLDTKLLNDEAFDGVVVKEIKKLMGATSNYTAEWEEFKQQIKIKAIERSSIAKWKERKEENELNDELEFLIAMESDQPGGFTKEIREVKSKLERISSDRHRAAVIRARAETLWAGEAPTKRALADEKRYACSKEIKEIIHNNEVTSEKEKIHNAFIEYYQELFGPQKVARNEFERDFLHLMTSLEEEVKERLEEPITVQEIECAIDDLASGKTPGPDGLGAAFYRAFKSPLAQFLLKVFAEAYEVRRAPPSFRMSHIVLIPKTDDPQKRLLVGSYRPISLTNVDYKIFMKILAKRLQSVIKLIVGPHQTCGVKGRTIATNIHVARNVLECCDAYSDRIAMLQLDLAKAFDRVSHDILFCILDYLNVGHVIIDGVKMAYADCTARVMVNGELTESVHVHSSVRQGCPLSPLLFDLYLEPFCLALINSNKITGYRLASAEAKVLAYADDIAVFCSDRDSVREVVAVADKYCRQTGSKINWDKSSGFWHGDWDSTPEHFAQMQWSVLPRKYLGVPLDCYRLPEQYWNEQTNRAREKSEGWQGRQLSMFSRTSVCNIFLVSKIWYVMSVLCMSRVNVQKIHRVFAVFIWASTWERSSRFNLFRPVKSGGLGLVHLFLRQVVSRFMYLRDQNHALIRTVIQLRLWKHIPDLIVSSAQGSGGVVTGYLREVVLACRMLQERFSMEYLAVVSRKELYKVLVDTLMPVPLYRAIYRGGPGHDVLKRVKKMSVKPMVKTFFFKLHTGTLPVKTWLEEKGLYVPWTTNCLLCKKPENLEHVFIDCWDPIFHWDVLQRTIKKQLPIDPYGIRFLPTENTGGIPYDLIMLLGLHSLWRTRMQVRHADVNTRSVRENFVESVAYLREVYRAQPEPPQWISILDDLVTLKRF